MKPVLQALLLADHVYQDVHTGKKIIAGTFDTLAVLKHPASEDESLSESQPCRTPAHAVQRAGTPYAYINVTEIRGDVELEVRYVNLDSRDVLFRTSPIRVTAKSPLDAAEVVVPVPELPRKPGVYALELFCENELLGAHRVVVREIEEPR